MYENALRSGIEYSMTYASADYILQSSTEYSMEYVSVDYILQSSIEYSMEYVSDEYKSVIPAKAEIHLYVAPPSFLRKQESIRSFSGVEETIILSWKAITEKSVIYNLTKRC